MFWATFMSASFTSFVKINIYYGTVLFPSV